MNFSATLKELRESKNITQEELASYLKVSRPTIAGYETKNRQPDYEKLLKLSQFFNVTVDYLLTGSDETPLSPFCQNPDAPSEKALSYRAHSTFQRLSLQSKQDAISYMKLLELRDKEYLQKK